MRIISLGLLMGVVVAAVSNFRVKDTPARGATTGANPYGFEAEVRGGVVTRIRNGVGNMAIPSDGFVLSGHGTSRTWLRANAMIGARVVDASAPPPPPPPGSALLPDIGVLTLGNFPDATTILHGLSVGWGDTYPATLPDRAIDVTGLPDGNYTVKVTADWQNFWQEANESNQSATALIRITGNSVALLTASDGL